MEILQRPISGDPLCWPPGCNLPPHARSHSAMSVASSACKPLRIQQASLRTLELSPLEIGARATGRQRGKARQNKAKHCGHTSQGRPARGGASKLSARAWPEPRPAEKRGSRRCISAFGIEALKDERVPVGLEKRERSCKDAVVVRMMTIRRESTGRRLKLRQLASLRGRHTTSCEGKLIKLLPFEYTSGYRKLPSQDKE